MFYLYLALYVARLGSVPAGFPDHQLHQHSVSVNNVGITFKMRTEQQSRAGRDGDTLFLIC